MTALLAILAFATIVQAPPLPPVTALPSTNTYALDSLEWDAVPTATGYLLMATNQLGQVLYTNLGPTVTRAAFHGLRPTNIYTFALMATNDSGVQYANNTVLWRPPLTNWDTLNLVHGPLLGPFTNEPVCLPLALTYGATSEGWRLVPVRSNNLPWIRSHEIAE